MYKICTANTLLLHFKIKTPSTFFYTKLLFFLFELYIHSATDTAFKAEIQLKTGNSVCVT